MKKILINATQQEELRVAIIEGRKLIDLDIDTSSSERKKGSIYKGKIARIEPGLDAVFVDYGEPKHGFLPFREIAPAYYKNNQPDNLKGSTAIAKSLRQGQSLLVQVQRENRDNKGAALTTFISLAGRYLVLMPNSQGSGGVSRRVEEKDRAALREMLAQLDTGGDKMSIIARTQGAGRNAEALQQDFDSLKTLWESIIKTAKSQTAPFLVYRESNIAICALRDHFSDDIEKIMIDNEKIFNDAHDFMQRAIPDQMDKLNLYQEPIPLFERYDIENQIEAAFHRTILLPSGGSLVLDQTEALLSIDINSGKSTKGGNIEETALNTNLEAAEEVALQLRLRDLGGLIVIDFIDMESIANRKAVEERLYRATRVDQARVQLDRISRFGLLEMSRQRLRPSLSESNHIRCPQCEGKGVIRSLESGALAALRLMEKEAIGGGDNCIVAHLPIETASFLLNKKRDKINEIEMRHDVRLVVIPDAHICTPDIQKQKYADNEHFQAQSKKHKPLTHTHYLARDDQSSPAPVLDFASGVGKSNNRTNFLSGLFSFLTIKRKKQNSATKTEKKQPEKRQRRRQASSSDDRSDDSRNTRRSSNSRRRGNQRRGGRTETTERKDDSSRRRSGSDRYQRANSPARRQDPARDKKSVASEQPSSKDSQNGNNNQRNRQRDTRLHELENKADSFAAPMQETSQTPATTVDKYPQETSPREAENKATPLVQPVPQAPQTPVGTIDKSLAETSDSKVKNQKQEAYSPPDSSKITHLKQVETKSAPEA